VKLSRAVHLIYLNFRLCVTDIWSNRLRTVITSFGIFLGVASYLVNVAFIRGIDNDIKSNLEEIGGLKIITIKNKKSATESEAIIFGNSTGIHLKEIEDISRTLPYISSVLPKEELDWSLSKANGKNAYVKPIAINNDYFRVYNYQVQKGRLFTINEYNENQSVCLIGSRTVKKLFSSETSAIGQSITLLNHSFTIVGIIKSESQYSWKAVQFLLPYTLYKKYLTANKSELEEVAVELKSSDFVAKARFEFSSILKQRHRGIQDFEIESNQSKIKEMRSASKGITILLGSISIITLLIGGISIMNIMFAAIGDRIREIGIRKALGAKKTDIFMQFIIEAIVVSFVGGLPGLILGASVILFPKGIFPYNPALTAPDFCLAIFFTLTAGILSGLSPALRASTMLPVEALRY
jgi:putative ABC transport system permease protein